MIRFKSSIFERGSSKDFFGRGPPQCGLPPGPGVTFHQEPGPSRQQIAFALAHPLMGGISSAPSSSSPVSLRDGIPHPRPNSPSARGSVARTSATVALSVALVNSIPTVFSVGVGAAIVAGQRSSCSPWLVRINSCGSHHLYLNILNLCWLLHTPCLSQVFCNRFGGSRHPR